MKEDIASLKKAGVALLITDKARTVIKTQRWVLHNDKRVNPARIHNTYKYKCI